MPKNLHHKEKTVGTVRDNEIRQNGMRGIAAVTPDAGDGDFMMNSFTINKIDKITPVVAVNMEIAMRVADRTGFRFWSEQVHITDKKRF